MRNPNVRILLIALAAVLIVAALGVFLSFEKDPDTQDRESPSSPIAAQNGGVPGAQAYLRVQVGDQVWEPIALADGDEYTINQPDGKTNVVRVTATGAVMHSSTCDNQSCVEQGEVTLENRDMRVLSNMIICLPNEVILEVLTPGEAGMEAVP